MKIATIASSFPRRRAAAIALFATLSAAAPASAVTASSNAAAHTATVVRTQAGVVEAGYRKRHRVVKRRHARDVEVDAPTTYVRSRRGKVVVDAPYTYVERRRSGVRVRAPFVDLWVPRH